jgi:hypothetical protein
MSRILISSLFSLFLIQCSSSTSPPSCPQGVLVKNQCYPVNCSNRFCPNGFVCRESLCTEVACFDILCPKNEACAGGNCYPKNCLTQNCPALGEVCIEEECETAPCLGVQCPNGQSCANGLCYPEDCPARPCPGREEVCINDSCVPATCAGVTCPPKQRCANGYCYPVDCEKINCPGYGEICIDEQCVGATCANVTCPTGQRCAAGYCYPEDCSTFQCAGANEVCVDGVCVSGTCLGIPCSADQECVRGTCYQKDCAATQCAPDEVCYHGACVLGPCVGVVCPEGQACENGACVQIDTCITTPLTCSGHGSCSDQSGKAACVCQTGYAGANCEICANGYQDNDVDFTCLPTCATAGLDCGGYGSCSDSTGTAICVCQSGYTGMNCEDCTDGYQDNDGDGTCLPTCLAAGMTCSGHGTCDDGGGTAACSCQIEYTGADCDLCADGFQDDDTNGTCEPMCTTWIKRRDITLTGAAQDQTNIQIKLMIPYSNAMQQTYGDLRFFSSQGDPLPLWIQSTSPQSAEIWIKVSLLPAGGTTCVLRYGNACVTSTSDYAGTFPWLMELVENGGAFHTSLKVDSGEWPHISYRHQEGADTQLKYATRGDAGWTVEVVDGPAATVTGKHTSLVLDSNDVPHISYYDQTNRRLRHATWNGLSWSKETVEQHATTSGGYTSIDVDSQNRPAISYRGNAQEVKYAHWNGATWDIQVVDPAGAALTSLKLDSHDVPYILYLPWSWVLKAAHWNLTQWDIQQVDVQSDYAAIAIDSDDHPHVAHYDIGCIGLKYVSYDGTAWSVETAKPIPGVCSHFVGLVMDSSGRPHISYEDAAVSSFLGYATKTEAGWQIEAIDFQGGDDSSIDLDKSGFPHISYVAPNVGLKYAYRRKTASPEPTVTLGEETTSVWKNP